MDFSGEKIKHIIDDLLQHSSTIIGGISIPEIKAAYDQSNLKNRDIFIGSDEILTPTKFLDEVERLQNPREFFQIQGRSAPASKPPDFLLREMKPVAQPVSHVHLKAKTIVLSLVLLVPKQQGSLKSEPPEKRRNVQQILEVLEKKISP
ncbi:AIF_HP2_G0052180.mRNA.1.CDS.1 [Saccharomyces cerevisiae]|nr:AIF_HP2_G0052180.mRNA.1.CDS.1 [Saccharomyces cerevisiae]CAI6796398.1 AIF_HP2_G0052180.mRNA.1.CDS.1 [Saccharomyces cerevisiae]